MLTILTSTHIIFGIKCSVEHNLFHLMMIYISSLLSNGYQGLFYWGQSSQGMKLTTHLHVVPRSKICRAVPSLLNVSSWHCG